MGAVDDTEEEADDKIDDSESEDVEVMVSELVVSGIEELEGVVELSGSVE